MKKLFSYTLPFVAMFCVSLLFSCKSNLEMPESPDEKFGSSSSKKSSSSVARSSSSLVSSSSSSGAKND